MTRGWIIYDLAIFQGADFQTLLQSSDRGRPNWTKFGLEQSSIIAAPNIHTLE